MCHDILNIRIRKLKDILYHRSLRSQNISILMSLINQRNNILFCDILLLRLKI